MEMQIKETRKSSSRFYRKVVLITGGSSGMGLETAGYFAKEGAIVNICGTNKDKGNEAIQYIKNKFGKTINFQECNVTKPDNVKNWINTIVKKYERIDILFNNAGISSKNQQLSKVSEEDWNNVININLSGVFYCMKYVIGEMMKNRNGGVIVNNASSAALLNVSLKAPYNASKAAVIALTQTAALDYAKDNIRINAIAPGIIADTGMNSKENIQADIAYTQKKLSFTPMNRFGTLKEVAMTVLWLSSDEATFITGTTVSVDGGFSAGK